MNSSLFRKGNCAERIGATAPVYLATVIKCLVNEIFKMAENIAQYNKKNQDL